MMSKEKLFDYVVRRNFRIARKKTGYSFYGLFSALNGEGAVAAARRYISPKLRHEFQEGLRELKQHGLLHLSVEYTIIAFGRKGYLFSEAEVTAAGERLRLIKLLVR